MDLQLDDKVAIVTGGSRGIGKAITMQLAREGARVAIVARTQTVLDSAAAEIAADAAIAPVLAVSADTTSLESVRAMVARVAESLGPPTILVNCASAVGTSVAFRLPDLPVDVFQQELNVKVLGYLRCINQVAPHMIASRWGRIINISGLAARQPLSIIGSARNAAVVALTKNAAEELGPHGINVTVVHPGATMTDHYLAEMDRWAAARQLTREQAIQRRFASNLLGQPIHPADIANVVAFLASPRSTAINGDVIAVAGGVASVIHY